MKLAIATNNAHKLQEIRAILSGKFDELLSLKDLGIDVDVEETGTTLEENALLKARTIQAICHIPTLADDTGLMVDALGGAPGVYSARYAGEEHNDASNRALLLKTLQNEQNRNAHFATVIAIVYPSGDFITSKGRVEGEILREERGNEGFGYDSLFYSYELKKTFAEASQEEKNSVSHRGRALRAMLEKLQTEK
mgnify:FL=1